MHFSSILTAGLLAARFGVEAYENGVVFDHGGYSLPDDHMLWGPMDRPHGRLAKREATSTTQTSTITSKVPDSACTNGPLSRSCWSNGFSIATDFDTKWPDTGKTVHYDFTITNTTCNPDGNGARVCMLINNQFPGPVIVANWGDTISVKVTNLLQANGTSIHWHGIRQWQTNIQDGTNGLTECPLAPGDSKTYTWQATQFGTSWYHSHFSTQYGDGVVGSIQINGPATSNYDIDLGAYPIQDWYYDTAYQLDNIATVNLQSGLGPPPADNVLINGTNKNAASGGSYNLVTLKKGKKHRLRLINTSVDNNIRVSLDNHPFTVISSDFVPIHPYTTNWILLGIGQRYDVIIDANQTSGSYWFRAETAQDCASSNNFYGRSIFTYSDATEAVPTTKATTIPSVCQDESPLVPWWKTTVPSSDFDNQVRDLEVDINVEQVATNNQSIVVWGINLTAIDIAWEKPTLQYVIDGNTSYPTSYNLIELPTANIWTYWIIQETSGTPVPIPHPIHLHGHDVSLTRISPIIRYQG
jgi:FtsP/CotA-like multicopper oxidase with cupredoxin domain